MDITHYGGGWIGYTPAGPPLPRELRPNPIVIYRATLPDNATGSSVTFAPGVDRADLITALNRRPEYLIWPDEVLRDEADLTTLALLKILASVSFGGRWPSLDPDDLLTRALDPGLAARGRPWLRVHGEVFPSGDVTFGSGDIPDDDLPAPDILGGSDDAFIRAAIGADLIRLIRRENASWDPFPDGTWRTRA